MLSVVVVNWNAGARLGECLHSIEVDGLAGREVIVVDNGSSDGSTAESTATRPWVRVLRSDHNRGFAAGANQGAAAAQGKVLVFLNPDARLSRGALAALATVLDADTSVAVVGGALVDDAGAPQASWAHHGPLAHALLDTRPVRAVVHRASQPHPVDWVYGTFMALRRTAFEALGGFDEHYFMYGEDMDLCHRVHRRGQRVMHVPAATAAHGPNVSARQRYGAGRDAAVLRGELRFYRRRLGRPAANLFRGLAAGKAGVRLALALVTARGASARASYATLRASLSALG